MKAKRAYRLCRASNHQPVRWHPLLLASFEFCGVTMEHQTIQNDSSWEYVGGAYVFPHNLVRGLSFLHENIQPNYIIWIDLILK